MLDSQMQTLHLLLPLPPHQQILLSSLIEEKNPKLTSKADSGLYIPSGQQRQLLKSLIQPLCKAQQLEKGLGLPMHPSALNAIGFF